MRYGWIIIVALHLVPVVSAALTWKKPWGFALERIVRVQVIATLAFFVLFPLAFHVNLGYPLSSFQFMDIFYWFSYEGVFNTFPIVSAAAVTVLAAFIRRRATRGREDETP